jgi:branched-chain amino acid transport system permease protein
MRPPALAARGAVLALLATAPLYLGHFRLGLLTSILSFGLFAASLDLLIGYTGLPSLGHAAYLGIGGFASALLALHVTPNVFAQLGVATGAAAIGAAIVGAFAVRSRGIYFLMLTLAAGELLSELATNWTSVTQGTNGLSGLPNGSFYPGDGRPLDPNLHRSQMYYYVLGAFLVGYVVLKVIVASPFGRALVGLRENDARMRSLGYDVTLYKISAFVLAGAVAGFAGALTVEQQKFVDYTIFSFTNFSALAVIALIIGGRGTLLGGVLGGGFVYVVREELAGYFSQHWMIVLGLVFVFVVYTLPGGLVGGARTLRRLAARGRPAIRRREATEAAL